MSHSYLVPYSKRVKEGCIIGGEKGSQNVHEKGTGAGVKLGKEK